MIEITHQPHLNIVIVKVRNDTLSLLTIPLPIMHVSPYPSPHHLPIRVLTVLHFLRAHERTKLLCLPISVRLKWNYTL